jgi:hypothetical protein
MKRLLTMPGHPLLFAAVPLLFLYARNARNLVVARRELAVLLLVALAAAAAAWLVLTLILRGPGRAALVVTAFATVFFAWGQLVRLLPWHSLGQKPVLVVAGWLMLTAGVIVPLLRIRIVPGPAHGIINAVGTGLIAFNLVTAGPVLFRPPALRPASGPSHLANGADRPDIYFIILDGYARQDILHSRYGYDNSEFVRFLREQGFHVADQGRSNYSQTLLSLAATLNLTYLDSLAIALGPESEDRGPVSGMVLDNRVMRELRARGYRVSAFASGYAGTEFTGADRYLRAGGSLSDFQRLLLNVTPLGALRSIVTRTTPFDAYREQVLYALDNLPEAGADPGPDFVVAHVVSPHPPFVFGAGGEHREPRELAEFSDGSHLHAMDAARIREYVQAYTHQLEFISRRVEQTVRRLKVRAQPAPVVILLADHGPGSNLHWDDPNLSDLNERLGILYAVSLPDRSYTEFEGRNTPVNLFRILLNRYGGGDYTLLPDRSYFSTWGAPYEFTDVAGFVPEPRKMPDSVGALIFRVADTLPIDAGDYMRRLINKRYPGVAIRQSYLSKTREYLTIEQAYRFYRAGVADSSIEEMGTEFEPMRGDGPDWARVTVLFFTSCPRTIPH